MADLSRDEAETLSDLIYASKATQDEDGFGWVAGSAKRKVILWSLVQRSLVEMECSSRDMIVYYRPSAAGIVAVGGAIPN